MCCGTPEAEPRPGQVMQITSSLSNAVLLPIEQKGRFTSTHAPPIQLDTLRFQMKLAPIAALGLLALAAISSALQCGVGSSLTSYLLHDDRCSQQL